jgi:extracellular elastinolytic metalloproteinase
LPVRLLAPSARRVPRKVQVPALAAVAALAVALLPSAAFAVRVPAKPSAGVRKPAGEQAANREKARFFDSRQSPAATRVLRARSARLSAKPSAAVSTLRSRLGNEGIVSIDPLTATPRMVARTDGLLTGPSTAPPARIALDYVARHAEVFKLDAKARSALRLAREYTSVDGTHHLSWVQYQGGVPVFGNGLQANVTRDGRLVNVYGSPLGSLAPVALKPALEAGQARARAVRDVGGKAVAAKAGTAAGARRATTFAGGDRASLVLFQAVSGLRLAWQTISSPGKGQLFQHVVDARSGAVLYRRSLVDYDTGEAWDDYPGAPRGGVQRLRDFTARGWLGSGASVLFGNNAHVYSDVNDDDAASATEEIPPSGRRTWSNPFTDFNAAVGGLCSASFPCGWNPAVPNSWQVNRRQSGTQLFYFVNRFHDHLQARPIGFNEAAGNFQLVNRTGRGRGGDPVQGEGMDGADTAGGLPDSDHIDNANFATPPDGIPPRMQTYLWHDPADPADPFLQADGSDEADIVYHEYTHGLSNRLVVDANGNSTLGNVQAGSMGEAWSDWYALDFLVGQGLERDTVAPGELIVGRYVEAGGQNLIRTQPLDCPVGTTSAACPGTPGAGPGGYTYGDFGKVIGIPEVHADGEIWGETLWDLRKALGQRLSESLVTRAMELSPANPSFLDMRNSILQADKVGNKGRARNRIWSVFAQRGMGFFAAAADGDDAAPIEDFGLPPAKNSPKGTLRGTVTDVDTGKPIAGALVAFGGHASGFPGDYAALTDAAGHYAIRNVFFGTYQKVGGSAPGYDRVLVTVTVDAAAQTQDFALRRDWAALAGGGSVVDFDGPDFSDFGCGPDRAIDQSLGNGWGSTTDFDAAGVAAPKFVTVRLPLAVNIARFAVDPGNTCGDGDSASTRRFRIETSRDGTTFAVSASGRFGAADRHRLNPVTPAAGTGDNVKLVRFTMIDPQLLDRGKPLELCPGPFSGCQFMDMSELEVYGLASCPPDRPRAARGGRPSRFTDCPPPAAGGTLGR